MGQEKTIEILKQEISKQVIGKENEIELMLVSLLNDGHVLMESMPGTGKTLLAKSFAASIGGRFSRVQFTPDVLPSDVTGIRFFNPQTQEFELKAGPVMTNILLGDEINRATPRTQSSLLEAMEERQVTVDGNTLRLESPFMVIATQNPVESQQGTFPLPAAQMDRFFIKVVMEYPGFEEERRMIKTQTADSSQKPVQQIISLDELKSLKESAGKVRISPDIETYILQLCRETRNHPSIELGASPRGTLALVKASRGLAFIKGRDFVTPTDVKHMMPYVIGHRIHLSDEASFTKEPNEIIADILHSVPVPVESGAV